MFSQPQSHVPLDADSLPMNWSGYSRVPKLITPRSRSTFQSSFFTTYSAQACWMLIILPRQAEKSAVQSPCGTASWSRNCFIVVPPFLILDDFTLT